MSDPRREVLSDTLMDCRASWPWEGPSMESTLTYREAMRKLADILIRELDKASDRPFVVRQFEGTPWVPLHEAARLHDAVQESGLTIATLRNDLTTARQAGLDEAKRRLSLAGMHDGNCPEPRRPCTCGLNAAIDGSAGDKAEAPLTEYETATGDDLDIPNEFGR